jgi:hypothetical protein
VGIRDHHSNGLQEKRFKRKRQRTMKPNIQKPSANNSQRNLKIRSTDQSTTSIPVRQPLRARQTKPFSPSLLVKCSSVDAHEEQSLLCAHCSATEAAAV